LIDFLIATELCAGEVRWALRRIADTAGTLSVVMRCGLRWWWNRTSFDRFDFKVMGVDAGEKMWRWAVEKRGAGLVEGRLEG